VTQFFNLFRSSSYQVGGLFAGLMLLGVFFVWYWLVIASDNTLLRESEAAVEAELRAFRLAERLGGPSGLTDFLRARVRDDPSYFYALRLPDGTLESGNLPAWPQDRDDAGNGTFLFEVRHADVPGGEPSSRPESDHFDVMARRHVLEDGRELLVGRDVDDLEIAQFVAEAFGWAMVAILLSICALSIGVAYYIASRFKRIAATTERIIATGNLRERLQVDGDWDDLSKLSKLLNQMLEELASRVDGIQSVSDSIAHDLRTPLTRLRTSIEANVNGDQRVVLLEEIDDVLRIFNSLLRISSIEAGKQPIELKPVEIHSLIADVVDLYEPLATDAEIDLRIGADQELFVAGDRDLIFQALANVLDNAIKFSPRGGVVSVSERRVGGDALISVMDSGPGIPREERAQALERFGRLDASRSSPGNGLGLPLAVAVARRHGGDLHLERGEGDTPGLSVRLRLPLKAV